MEKFAIVFTPAWDATVCPNHVPGGWIKKNTHKVTLAPWLHRPPWMTTVLSFIYKVSFPSWRSRNASEKLWERTEKMKKKKRNKNKTTGALKLRWGKGRKKRLWIYICQGFYSPARYCSLFEDGKKEKKKAFYELTLAASLLFGVECIDL